MVRVLQVFGRLDYGGAESMLMNIYRNTDSGRVRFDFVVHTGDVCKYDAEICERGGTIYHAPRLNARNCLEYRKWWDEFFGKHPEYRIVHLHIRSTASIIIGAADKHNVITVVHSHSTSNGSGFSSVVKRVLQYRIRYSADYLLACSRASGEWLFGKKACESERFHVIANAIDTGKYKFNESTRALYRKQLGIENRFVVCHIGRFHPSKNHPFLLRVFAEIVKRRNDALLLLIGDGELRSETESDIKRLGLENSVILLGLRSDVPELLQAADCFVFPSRWEGLPVSVVEAQASGLPCYVSDVITKEVAVSDLVRYISLNESPEKWADAVLSGGETRKDVIKEIVNAGFDIKGSVEWLTEFYESAAGDDKACAPLK